MQDPNFPNIILFSLLTRWTNCIAAVNCKWHERGQLTFAAAMVKTFTLERWICCDVRVPGCDDWLSNACIASKTKRHNCLIPILNASEITNLNVIIYCKPPTE